MNSTFTDILRNHDYGEINIARPYLGELLNECCHISNLYEKLLKYNCNPLLQKKIWHDIYCKLFSDYDLENISDDIYIKLINSSHKYYDFYDLFEIAKYSKYIGNFRVLTIFIMNYFPNHNANNYDNYIDILSYLESKNAITENYATEFMEVVILKESIEKSNDVMKIVKILYKYLDYLDESNKLYCHVLAIKYNDFEFLKNNFYDALFDDNGHISDQFVYNLFSNTNILEYFTSVHKNLLDNYFVRRGSIFVNMIIDKNSTFVLNNLINNYDCLNVYFNSENICLTICQNCSIEFITYCMMKFSIWNDMDDNLSILKILVDDYKINEISDIILSLKIYFILYPDMRRHELIKDIFVDKKFDWIHDKDWNEQELCSRIFSTTKSARNYNTSFLM